MTSQLTRYPSLPVGSHGEGWYLPGNNPSSELITEEAYRLALDYCKKELSPDEYQRLDVGRNHSIHDVQKLVLEAKKKYDDSHKTRKKVQKWLEKLTSQIVFYSSVLDVLVQHHPEYVALAWGTMKFVFAGVLNHEELMVEYARMLTTIGQVLPRTELNAVLYPTERMKYAASKLYACMLSFFQDTLKWYKSTSTKRVLSSIYNPFELRFKALVDQINEWSREVDQIASAAARAELRDLHTKVDQLVQVSLNIQTLTSRIHPDVSEIRGHLWSLRIDDCLQSLGAELIPTTPSPIFHGPRPELHAQTSPFLLRQLSLWANTPGSTLLVLRVGLRAEPVAKWFAATVIRLLQTANPFVLWIMPPSPIQSHGETLATVVLKSLIARALTHDAVRDKLHGINMPRFSPGQHTSREWLELLCLLVREIPKLFIAIDTGSLGKPSSDATNAADPKEEEAELISLLQTLVDTVERTGRCQIKVFVLSYHHKKTEATNLATGLLGALNRSRIDFSVQLPPPVPAARRHIVARQARNFRLQMRGVIRQAQV